MWNREEIMQVFKNPDGTISTKRTHAFWAFCVATIVALGTAVLYWYEKMPAGSEIMILGLVGAFLGYAAACLGISSFDNKTYFQHGKEPTPPTV